MGSGSVTEGFQLFESMLDGLRFDVTKRLAQIRPMTEEERQALFQQQMEQMGIQVDDSAALAPEAAPAPQALAAPRFDESDPTTWGNPGRNDPCPCGSGEKFKHCHGKL